MLAKFLISASLVLLALFIHPSLADPAQILALKTVVFGGDRIYPPFEWSEKGHPTGFHIDLEDAVADLGKVKAEHRLGDWPDIVHALETGDVDVVPMLVSEERQRKFTFTAPFYFMDHAIYAAPDAKKAYRVEDVAGYRVAVEGNSYAQKRLETEHVGVELVLTANTFDALKAVVEERADYAILTTAVADRLIEAHALKVQRFGLPFWPQGYAFATRKDRTELAAWLQASLNLVIATGRYQEIYDDWKDSIEPSRLTMAKVLRRGAFILGPLVLLALVGLGWSVSLRRVVAARTATLREELDMRRQAEERLRHFANYDPHTNLPEYHHLVDLMNAALETASRLAAPTREVAVLRLAELEPVIHTFGYMTAQSVVEAFARRLEEQGLDSCGYFGRGVFAVMGTGGAIKDNMEGLEAPINVQGFDFYPQMIVGLVRWPEHGRTAEELIRRAETALAIGQSRSHDWTVYDPSMEPDESALRIVTEFRKDRGAGLHAVLQPQKDLDTGQLVAAEALVRWEHPEMGALSPALFIPLLERAGLISHVTVRMIDEAARIAARLQEKGCDCTISINISASDILVCDLNGIIRGALDRHQIPPDRLKLELTETSIAQDITRVKSALDELSEIGIATSVDDFGTGYSSLSYLSTFPIRELKVDQMFVRDMVSSGTNFNIVKSTIALAHALDLTVVAEGAEDGETVDMLRSLGCDRVQGYVVAKPMPEEDFILLLSGGGRGAVH